MASRPDRSADGSGPPTCLVVLAHPEEDSFNGHLAEVTREVLEGRGYAVEVSDLYRDGFDPLEGPAHYSVRADQDVFRPQTEQRYSADVDAEPADVRREIEKLDRADLLVVQYPMWWYQPPAILKGWLDRVLTYGGVYTSQVRYDTGRYKGRRALLSVTTGGPQETFAHNGRNGDIDLLLWPMCFSLYFVGYSVLPPFVSFGVESGVRYSGNAEVEARLEAHREGLKSRLETVETTEPMAFSGWGDWDDQGRLRPGIEGHSPFMRHEP
jgi:NAD(P)H dehydrogenase (quinone)